MVSRETLSISDFFDTSDIWFADFLNEADAPWDLLRKGHKEDFIKSSIKSNTSLIPREGGLVIRTVEIPTPSGSAIVEAGSYVVGDEIELRAGVRIEAGAFVTGPTILGEGTQVRHGAYVRGGVLTGRSAVIGHASEVKSSILLNGAKAPHFAYLGDSILGNRVNLGAGTKVSNLKITNDEIVLSIEGRRVRTGLRKMGAIVGDGSETGCNSVLNPGVCLGKSCLVYPAIAVRNMYYKSGTVIR